MSDLPSHVFIREEGPREGFQIEPCPMATKDKIALIEMLADTGVTHIQTVSFVNPVRVPGWADAAEVVSGMRVKPGIEYTALWFNQRGVMQALEHRDKLHMTGDIVMVASEAFSQANLKRSKADNIAANRTQAAYLVANGIPIHHVGVMAAFGCNYSGDVPIDAVLTEIADGMELAAEVGGRITEVTLADSMGWCTPGHTERLVGETRNRWPDIDVILHLHDTRGQGVVSAYAALKMGIKSFDATVGGLGGCPFAGQPGATGNIASEELVLLCHEMGIETGIDLDALIETARFAESIVGHRLPSALSKSSSLASYRTAAKGR